MAATIRSDFEKYKPMINPKQIGASKAYTFINPSLLFAEKIVSEAEAIVEEEADQLPYIGAFDWQQNQQCYICCTQSHGTEAEPCGRDITFCLKYD